MFSNEIDVAATPLASLEPGALVELRSDRDVALGVGYANPATLIAVRLLAAGAARALDAAWFARRLGVALALRERLGVASHGRIVYGESDGLPGLVLDRYGEVLVGQIATLGMERLRPLVEAAIREVLPVRTLVWKHDGGARALERLPEGIELAWGELPRELEIIERRSDARALEYRVPFEHAQKTGWFYDQADNRRSLARFLPSGARVLDVCSYAGGWAVAALAAGASAAVCVDASAAALEAADANARRNGYAVAGRRGDAFDVLAELERSGERFDAVILDPPAFIKRKRDIATGEAAYRKLNQLGLGLLVDDGLLISCSCSWHLSEHALLSAVQGAARRRARRVQVLRFGTQSADHPVHPAIPETRYLKALFCRALREE